MIRISLVIPTHNRAAQLVAALESVVRQDLPRDEWECVVVSNNSTDDTEARFAAFAAAHPGCGLRLVAEEGPGVSYARNRGLREAQAPLVAFIDDDERVNEGFLRAYLEFFEMPIANPMDFGERVRPFPAGRVPGGGNMAFRCAGLAGYGGFDPTLGRVNGELIGGEENDFFERLLLGGETIWYVPGAVMWHIIPPAKLTGAYFRRLSYNVGVSQRLRAEIHRRLPKTFVLEIAKWAATLVLCCTMPPRKSRWLLRMRLEISRGLFTKIKN